MDHKEVAGMNAMYAYIDSLPWPVVFIAGGIVGWAILALITSENPDDTFSGHNVMSRDKVAWLVLIIIAGAALVGTFKMGLLPIIANWERLRPFTSVAFRHWPEAVGSIVSLILSGFVIFWMANRNRGRRNNRPNRSSNFGSNPIIVEEEE